MSGLVRGLARSVYVPQLLLCSTRTTPIVKPVCAFACGAMDDSTLSALYLRLVVVLSLLPDKSLQNTFRLSWMLHTVLINFR